MAEVAARHAAAVDEKARFPQEAVDRLRDCGLVSACAPRAAGGAGLDVRGLAVIARGLARACAATAMIWSMHQGQLASLWRYAGPGGFLHDLARQATKEQWLIASATSEAGIGGDLRRSGAALEPVTDSPLGLFRLSKEATTVSYGAHAEALFVTARRAPDAPASDQVLVAVPARQATLEKTGGWQPLGMRGTSSPGFRIAAQVGGQNVFPVPFADIAAGAMVPVTQVLWAATWAGLAAEALDRAVRMARRRAARSAGAAGGAGAAGAAAAHAPSALAEARWRLAGVDAMVDDMAGHAQRLLDGEAQASVGTAVRANSLKVGASESCLEIAHLALRACGMAGYSEQGPYSVARIIRDLSSSVVMIGNDRILENTARMMLVERRGDR
ncbi:acyl-CoA dehydrogenase family protein [Streptomyces sp. NPDC004031]